MTSAGALYAHLETKITTVARCWLVKRRDGLLLGFTDHDRPLSFDGYQFAADSGLTARALQQGTGLSVDNSEALGALTSSAIRDEDILAGRYDQAEVMAWLVNWTNTDERALQFRGTLGEIRRVDGQFTAELRGLTETLNQTRSRVYQKPCTAVLGDRACGVDLTAPGMSVEVEVISVDDQRVFDLGALAEFDEGWFAWGTMIALNGAAEGLASSIKEDRSIGIRRRIVLWSDLRAEISPGDRVKVIAGCNKQPATCRLKFDNFLNFRGFPDIPGDDWLLSYPARTTRNDGGAL